MARGGDAEQVQRCGIAWTIPRCFVRLGLVRRAARDLRSRIADKAAAYFSEDKGQRGPNGMSRSVAAGAASAAFVCSFGFEATWGPAFFLLSVQLCGRPSKCRQLQQWDQMLAAVPNGQCKHTPAVGRPPQLSCSPRPTVEQPGPVRVAQYLGRGVAKGRMVDRHGTRSRNVKFSTFLTQRRGRSWSKPALSTTWCRGCFLVGMTARDGCNDQCGAKINATASC